MEPPCSACRLTVWSLSAAIASTISPKPATRLSVRPKTHAKTSIEPARTITRAALMTASSPGAPGRL